MIEFVTYSSSYVKVQRKRIKNAVIVKNKNKNFKRGGIHNSIHNFSLKFMVVLNSLFLHKQGRLEVRTGS